MEVSVTFTNNPKTQDTLTIIKPLSESSISVYHVYSLSKHTHFALKIFPKNSFGTAQFENERRMIKLNHENVVQSFPILCHYQRFDAILTEFCQHGDFFDLVLKGNLNTEILIRTYFHQLINGLEYIHSQGIAHLDLKLENLMLGSDCRLKIIDFDHAQYTSDKSFKGKGTIAYRAPEIKNETCTDPIAADVFSAGVILYSFKAREFPFNEREDVTCQNINCYSTFVKNNNKFWEGKALLKKSKGFFSEDLIELVNGMLKDKPQERFTIKDIKESKWYQGPVLDFESLKAEMRPKLL